MLFSSTQKNQPPSYFLVRLDINGKDSGFDLVVKLKSDNEEDHVFQYLKIIEKSIAAKYNDFYSGCVPDEAEYRDAIESFKDNICALAVKIRLSFAMASEDCWFYNAKNGL
ncbi:hypothetical protein WICPIJ_008691 [Wickerhamomyces pijperi]|uniref:Uncharacterized protein n=1 Tax=Wickerhamomyces pijperi TaxID=599730 RepID=A0A9P8PW30_WICPI|nr:hypothetical protein WICPIJ_008691 [Wickerhamomyces pijperi]